MTSLLLAVSLYSQQIGDFFTLPAWMPRSVASANTPGSDPSGGNGWYIDEYTTNGIPTGRKVPRSPRLFPEIMSGINATFDGYFERQYFASQGQSNVWDVAEWGPRNDFRTFRFDPFPPGGQGGWDFSTNRTISSRRIFGYEEIGSLATHLMSMYYNLAMLRGPRRPGWIESANPENGRCWWSTTDTKVLNGTEIVPTFSWMSDPCAGSVDWSTASQTFACLYRDDVWDFRARYPYSGYPDDPTVQLMRNLSFGQRTSYHEFDYGDVAPDTIDGVSMGNLIVTNFPNADGWAITNSTRRLFSDRLSCMNQMLSLMDRTYHEPTVVYPIVGTALQYTAGRLITGAVPVTLTWNPVDSDYDLTLDGSISWESVSNVLRSSGSSVDSDGSSLHYRVSRSTTSANVSAVGTNTTVFGIIDGSTISDIIYEYELSVGSPMNESFQLFIAPTVEYGDPAYGFTLYGMHGEILYEGSHWCTPIPTPISTALAVGLEYKRSYVWRHTVGDVNLAATQPGWQSAGRVISNAYGAVAGCHRRDVEHSLLQTLPWDVNGSLAEYKSASGTYADRAGLLSFLSAFQSESYIRMLAWLGFDPEALGPTGITIDNADVTRVRNSVQLTPGKVSYTPRTYYTEVRGERSYGTTRIDSVTTMMRDYSYVADYVPLFGVSAAASSTCSSPSAPESSPFSADIKLGVLTRTDWRWKTIKRGNE